VVTRHTQDSVIKETRFDRHFLESKRTSRVKTNSFKTATSPRWKTLPSQTRSRLPSRASIHPHYRHAGCPSRGTPRLRLLPPHSRIKHRAHLVRRRQDRPSHLLLPALLLRLVLRRPSMIVLMRCLRRHGEIVWVDVRRKRVPVLRRRETLEVALVLGGGFVVRAMEVALVLGGCFVVEG
jgi:hypothetical protein